MPSVISYHQSGRIAVKCDAHCYNAIGPECHCICGGANHGKGYEQAIENTRELADKFMENIKSSIPESVNAKWKIQANSSELDYLFGVKQ